MFIDKDWSRKNILLRYPAAVKLRPATNAFVPYFGSNTSARWILPGCMEQLWLLCLVTEDRRAMRQCKVFGINIDRAVNCTVCTIIGVHFSFQ